MPIKPPVHQPMHKMSNGKRQPTRLNSTQRGYGYAWEKARKLFLMDNPLCVKCNMKGIVEPTTVVDHIIPHRGDKVLFWLVANWQALCKTCHDHKTLVEGQ